MRDSWGVCIDCDHFGCAINFAERGQAMTDECLTRYADSLADALEMGAGKNMTEIVRMIRTLNGRCGELRAQLKERDIWDRMNMEDDVRT